MNFLNEQFVPVIANDVWFKNDMLYARLSDGREIGVPLEWFPRLRRASPEALAKWRLIGRGIGIHWDDLDEDISVQSLISPELNPKEAKGGFGYETDLDGAFGK
jgi:hypothetical protein